MAVPGKTKKGKYMSCKNCAMQQLYLDLLRKKDEEVRKVVALEQQLEQLGIVPVTKRFSAKMVKMFWP